MVVVVIVFALAATGLISLTRIIAMSRSPKANSAFWLTFIDFSSFTESNYYASQTETVGADE